MWESSERRRHHEDDGSEQARAVFPACNGHSAGQNADTQGARTGAVDEARATGAVPEVNEDLLERGSASEADLGLHLEERLYGGAARSPYTHA